MGKIYYFTGGARSGKSTHAEEFINSRNYTNKIYLATGIPFDDEMKSRVNKHQKQRGNTWITLEAHNSLINKINTLNVDKGVILLDCLTNLISNVLVVDNNYNWDNITTLDVDIIMLNLLKEIEELIFFIRKSSFDIVIVSNEVGMGIVPMTPLGRHFRDICGKINQLVASYSNEAYFVVSGILMKIK